MNLANRPPLGLKAPKAKSLTVRKSAAGKDCTLRLPCCNYDSETTVLAHLRFFQWAGVAQKPPDFLAVYACSACHDALDARGSGQWEFEDVLRALGLTQIEMHREGRLVMK